LSDSRSSATTRDECRLLHVTPDQLQNCMESFFHDGRSPVGSETARWCLRQSSASMSSLGSRRRGVAPSEGVASARREAKRMINGSEELRVPTGATYVV
jgi:hypothetical protein